MEGRVVGWGVCCVDHLLRHCWGCYSAADDDCQRLFYNTDECDRYCCGFSLVFSFWVSSDEEEEGVCLEFLQLGLTLNLKKMGL